MKNTKRGNELTPEEQKHVLAAYCHRSTPSTRNGRSGEYPLQFASDEEWLANTDFDVTTKGKLDKRRTGCVSYPTWPNNPELRKPDSARLNFTSSVGENLTRLTPRQKTAVQNAIVYLIADDDEGCSKASQELRDAFEDCL